jgi:hypothetical protein
MTDTPDLLPDGLLLGLHFFPLVEGRGLDLDLDGFADGKFT